MLRLILMRHAKSSWGSPEIEDHDRVLNARGQRSAVAMGRWLNDNAFLPDTAISSTAARTAETLERLNVPSTVQFTQKLYLASASQMFDVLSQAEADCILMLGHNPGISSFAHALVNRPHHHSRFRDFPTCATLVADFPIAQWKDLKWGTGHTVAFAIPREILEE